MILLIRFILVSLIIYLIIRSFIRFSEIGKEEDHKTESQNRDTKNNKRISKEIGEYTDYEEIKK
jgi:hypothetical protein